MTTREKIIVAATGLVVAWGGITFFSAPPATDPETTVTPRGTDSAFVERSREQLEASRLTETEQYVLETAQAEWAPRPPVAQRSTPNTTRHENLQVEFRYTGYVNMGSENFAIINGHEYRTGDPVRNSAAVVDSITPAYVVLVLTNERKRQTIPFHKPTMKGE